MSESMSSQSPSQALLELRDVRRGFNQGESRLDVLNGASLSVRAGEMKALVGPSGSGKSTLLNIAGLLEQPDSGTCGRKMQILRFCARWAPAAAVSCAYF